MNSPMPSRPPRILYYSHDTYGLGHLRRTLALAGAADRQLPGARQLIVTGSPVARDLARASTAELVELPPVVKVGPDRYAPLEPGISMDALLTRRAQRLLGAARHFRPDLVVIDHAPLGLKGEALPLLRWLRANRPMARTLLGLRDIIDSPRAVRAHWRRMGVYDALERYYDRILVYGDRRVYDTARAYAIPRASRRRLRHVGYLGRVQPARSVELASRPGVGPTVLVTAGGGGDGGPVFEAAMDLAASDWGPAGLRMHLVLGPLLDRSARLDLHCRAAALGHVEVTDFAPAMAPLWARADAVVSMGGYNSLTEIVAQRLPAVVVPRVSPRREQLIRARAFREQLGPSMQVLEPGCLSARRLGEALDHLPRRRCARPPMNLEGLRGFTEELTRLAVESHRAPTRPSGAARLEVVRA